MRRVSSAPGRAPRPWERGRYGLSPYLQREEHEDPAPIRLIEGAAAGLMARLLRPGRRGLRRFAAAVIARGAALEGLEEAALDAEIARLRALLRAEGPTRAGLRDVYALTREVAFRTLGMRHHPSQIMAGRALFDGLLAELATGEGKTLTGLLPVTAACFCGLPAHVLTVNPYLSARDCETLRPALERLGLRVAHVETDMEPARKRAAYRADVVFTTHKDVCFDHLRDGAALGDAQSRARGLLRALRGGAAPGAGAPGAGGAGGAGTEGVVLSGLPFALLDEADLVLIDETRVPLVISRHPPGATGPAPEELAELTRALELAAALVEGVDFRLFDRPRRLELTEAGQARLAALCAGEPGIWRAKRGRENRAEMALTALHLRRRGHDYVVVEGAVQIVDEHTGRIADGRSWEQGLHQMIELKEGLSPTARARTEARTTYQRVFRRYMRLSGMTGTATGLETELWRVYGLRVRTIPRHLPSRREDLGVRLFRRADARWEAAAERAAALADAGRAVLAGTRSVAASEALAARLAARGRGARVLNALQDAQEAAIVAEAGRSGAVTIATGMAGRGTDIKLDAACAAAGGLHVLLTEPHESARVDRQLVGRAGRQGDPGGAEKLVSLEDELFVLFGGIWARAALAGMEALGLAELRWAPARLVLARAQARAERVHARARAATLRADRKMVPLLGFTGRRD